MLFLHLFVRPVTSMFGKSVSGVTATHLTQTITKDSSMPSQLNGLIRTLSWNDFHRVTAAQPAAGQFGTAAVTHSGFSSTPFRVDPIPHTRPARFRLVDSFNVSVTFDRSRSQVKSWVFSLSQLFQNDLLNHEQGHYNISALLSRDFFVEVMLIKSIDFATAAAGIAAVNQITARTVDRMGAVQGLYDREVHPEQNQGNSRGSIQVGWDTAIRQAFTQPRASGTTAPDGTPHKMLLVDALTAAGKRP